MTENKGNANSALAGCASLLMVSCLYGFNYTGIYNSSLSGTSGLAMLMVKLLVTGSIPIYIMLSGYLCRNKVLSLRYYLGLVRILFVYFLCSVAVIAYEQLSGAANRSPSQMIGALLLMESSDYSWCIPMYFCMFLTIPFLNMAYNGLQTKGQKQLLVLSFAALSVLPSLLNLYFQLYSVWWVRLYPLCYYFTGAYLGEYMPRPRLSKLALALLGFMGAYAMFFYFRYGSSGAAMSEAIAYDTWQVYIIAILLFVLLMNITMKEAAPIIGKLAELVLPAYLLSWISDSVIYGYLSSVVPEGAARYKWLALTVPLSLLAALVMAQLVMWLYSPVGRWVERLGQRPIFNNSDPLGAADE